MKTCTKCGETKPLDCFYTSKGAHVARCKVCMKLEFKRWYAANKDDHIQRNLANQKANIDRVLAKNKRWYADNVERARAQRQKYHQANTDKHAARMAKRRAAKRKAIPQWADAALIALYYATRQYLTEDTGFDWHVDHIIPLQGRNVCGLHVHFNLRVIPAKDNLSKSNHFPIE